MVGKLKFFVTIIIYGLNRSVLFWNYLDEKALFLKRKYYGDFDLFW